MRLAILTSHPIQYYAPLWRELAGRMDVHVFYCHQATSQDQARAGFGAGFEWDIDLTAGYRHTFLRNVASTPGTHHFSGCDTPDVGKALRAGRFDVVLIIGWHLKALVQGLMGAKAIGLPIMVRGDSQLATPRGALKRLIKAAVYPTALRMYDAALYVGERSRAYYRHYGYPDARLFFSPHCIDTVRFAEGHAQKGADLRARMRLNADDRIVLFAGKLVERKRPLDVVHALARLDGKQPRVQLMVAGSGQMSQAVEEEASRLGVKVSMLGFQNQSAMPAILAAADVLVLPSNGEETWGLVCNEALASGTPIIVSDAVGCAANLAADNDVGRVYPVGDVGALARAIDDVLDRPPSPDSIREVSATYSIAAAADGVEQAAAWLVGRKRGRAAGAQAPHTVPRQT